MRNNIIKQIDVQLNRKLVVAMDKVGETVMKNLEDYIQKNWYDAYSPTHYKRTYEFIRSITKTDAKFINGVCTVEVYFDEDKIKANYTNDGTWNQHASIHGEVVSNAIVEWIEYGNNPNRKTTAIYSYDGIHMIDAMVSWLKFEYIKLLKKELKIKTI